jgi:hypothetical protein
MSQPSFLGPQRCFCVDKGHPRPRALKDCDIIEFSVCISNLHVVKVNLRFCTKNSFWGYQIAFSSVSPSKGKER